MKLSTEDTGVDIPLMTSGNHHAVLTSIIDYGTQESEWEGVKKTKRECRIGFTFPDDLFEFDEEVGPEPRVKSVFATLSAHPKSKIYNILTSITGKGLPEEIELTDYVGLNCLINFKHEKNKKDVLIDRMASFSPLMKGQKKVKIEGTKVFDLDKFDVVVFQSLSEKEQAIIKRSPEFEALATKMPF